MTDEAKKDFTMRISQANKSGLVVILYEMYLIYLEDAVKAEGNREEFREAVRKGRGCINELMNSLNYDYEVAHNLLRLYIYVDREMAGADIRHSVEPLSHCRKVMTELMEAYRTVSREDISGPVMGNTQTVYAGLTYGKGKLTESLSHYGSRGFLA